MILQHDTPLDVRRAAAAQSQFEQRSYTKTMFSEVARLFVLAARRKWDQNEEAEKEKKKKLGKKYVKPEVPFYPGLSEKELTKIARSLGEAVTLDKNMDAVVCHSL